MEFIRLNLACGDRPHSGYLNIDIVPGKGDLCADCLSLPYADGSVSEILSEHFIEHLTRGELYQFFFQARRLLRPGGVLTLRAPCFRCLVEAAANEVITLERLDLYLFARHLHPNDFHRQGIWESKLLRLCAGYGFSEPSFQHGDEFEISMDTRRENS
mgnify:CR=1 FL=1